MRKLLCLVLLAACELQPAPKKQPPPAAPPTQVPAKPIESPLPVVADAGASAGAAAGPADGAGSAAPKIEITAACIEVGARIAQVYIDDAKDPAQKSGYQQDRANMIRKTSEACTAHAWSDEARKCYLKAKTPAELKACEQKFTPPQLPPKAGSAGPPGAGSSVQPGPGAARH